MKKFLTLALAAASLCYAGSVSAQCPDPATPAIPAEDVVSLLSGSYTQATGFNIGGWGQATVAEEVTAANGAPVYHITNFNYLGWEFHQHINVEGFDYMHVEFYPETQTPFGFTPISPGQEKPFIASDVKVGEWNSYDVPLTHWDNVAFNDLFQVKFDQGNGGSGYIANVYFWKDNRVIPALTASVSDIAMDGAVINYEVTLPEQLKGADVKVLLDGETEISNPYALTGLTPSTDYSYTLKAVAVLDDVNYESDEVNITFKTLRDPSNTPMWYDRAEVTAKDRTLTAEITMIANPDNTLTIEAVMGNWEGIDGLGGFQIHIAGDWGAMLIPDANGLISRTTSATFTDGQKVDIFIYGPYAGGAARFDLSEPYKFGAENEKPVTAIKPRLTASVEDITATGASIVYTVDMPAELAGAELKVLLNGETELSESPYILSGLTENTQYDYTIQAIATLDGETYESLEQPLSFRTLRDGAKAVSYYQIVNGMMPNNYKVGETEADRRPLPVSMLTELVYNTDQTVTVNFSVAGADQIVGFVPEVNIGDQWSGSLAGKAVDGVYSWTTPNPFEEGTKLHSYFWFQFPGGVQGIDMIDFVLGEGNEPIAYGEVACVVLTAKITDIAANVATPVTYYAVDAAGNYLLNEEIALNVKEGDAVIDGDFVTLPGRGTAVIEAVCGDFSAELTFNCLTSADATNVAKGVLGVASEAATNDPANATDDNEGSQLEFSCADTEEHSFALDLGKNHDIEVIEVVFEGASATQYTITVERETPDAPAARAKAESKVYEVTDGQGGGGLTVRKQFVEATPVVGRYVTLNTSKAFDKTWGIKLKELRVLGKESSNTPTGIESVEVEAEAPARYFRLDGIEVSAQQLSAGVYVKLQGNTASKIVVR